MPTISRDIVFNIRINAPGVAGSPILAGTAVGGVGTRNAGVGTVGARGGDPLLLFGGIGGGGQNRRLRNITRELASFTSATDKAAAAQGRFSKRIGAVSLEMARLLTWSRLVTRVTFGLAEVPGGVAAAGIGVIAGVGALAVGTGALLAQGVASRFGIGPSGAGIQFGRPGTTKGFVRSPLLKDVFGTKAGLIGLVDSLTFPFREFAGTISGGFPSDRGIGNISPFPAGSLPVTTTSVGAGPLGRRAERQRQILGPQGIQPGQAEAAAGFTRGRRNIFRAFGPFGFGVGRLRAGAGLLGLESFPGARGPGILRQRQLFGRTDLGLSFSQAGISAARQREADASIGVSALSAGLTAARGASVNVGAADIEGRSRIRGRIAGLLEMMVTANQQLLGDTQRRVALETQLSIARVTAARELVDLEIRRLAGVRGRRRGLVFGAAGQPAGLLGRQTAALAKLKSGEGPFSLFTITQGLTNIGFATGLIQQQVADNLRTPEIQALEDELGLTKAENNARQFVRGRLAIENSREQAAERQLKLNNEALDDLIRIRAEGQILDFEAAAAQEDAGIQAAAINAAIKARE